MRIQGESWERWVYPVLLGFYARPLRKSLPQSLLVEAAASWLRIRNSMSPSPYIRAVSQAGRLVLPEFSLASFLSDHLRFIADFYLHMADMMDSSRTTVKGRLLDRLILRIDGLRAAIETGRGVLVPTIQTTVPLRMIFADFPDGIQYNLVLHRQYQGIIRILEKADRSWNFLFLEDGPGRRIMDALQRGQVVICNIDHVYPGTEVTLARVLGRAAIVPSGAFRVAHRYNSLVVPLTVTEQGQRVVIRADRVYDWQEMDSLPIASMLARIHPMLDDTVLLSPSRWFGWGNLINRWQAWKGHVHAAAS